MAVLLANQTFFSMVCMMSGSVIMPGAMMAFLLVTT